MNKYKTILLFSGGVDSFVAYHYLDRPKTLYFNLNTKYSDIEKRNVLRLVPTTIVEDCLDVGSREQGVKAYVPFRNLMLVCLAAKYSDTIVIAGLKDDKVSDKNEEIFKEFSKILSRLEGRQIEVVSPFWEMTKRDVVAWYLQNIWNINDLLHTFSCYEPHEYKEHCQACPACFRRWCAFWVNGIRLTFENDLLLAEYYHKALMKQYDPQRNDSIIEAIDAYRNRH